MIGRSKPFDKQLHANNDPKSRIVVKKFFAERDIILVDHPNKCDIDLITEDGKLRVEVEHRNSWNKRDFPYDEVNVPERKAKFFKDGNTYYVILSKNYKRLGFISAAKIQRFIKLQSPKESSNCFMKKGEYFYKIPQTEFEFFDV